MPPNASTSRSLPRAPRRAKNGAQLLDPASRIFATRVYHLVTMEEVAHAARVGKGTLYRYFPSKEDLYLAIVDEAFGLLIDRLAGERAGAGPPAHPPAP